MIYHIAAAMDLLPLLDPIRLIGNWISFLEKRLLGTQSRKKEGECCLYLQF